MTQRQAPRPPRTVGDTMTIVHRIAAAPGTMAQARLPTDSTLVTLTAAPTITRERDSIRIAYPVTLWAPGRNELVIPGPVLVRAGARPDTLPDLRVTLDVASVLPPGERAESLQARPPREWMPSAERSIVPFLVLVPLTLLVLALLQWAWRRRGPFPPALPSPTPPGLTADRVQAWLAAGEGRLLLRHIDAASRGDARFDAWRAEVEAVRFTTGHEAEIARLAYEGWRMLGGTP